MIRWKFVLSGRVQGVGLRWRAKMAAQQFQLTGTICNLSNGAVALELQGEQYHIDSFLRYLHELPGISYTFTEVKELPLQDETQFRVKYS